jgi:hypothetical protein
MTQNKISSVTLEIFKGKYGTFTMEIRTLSGESLYN